MNGEVVVLVAIVAIVVGMSLPLVMFARFYKRIPPDKAMVIYGKQQTRYKGYRIVTGGAKFIWPLVESYEFLPLDVRTIELNLGNVKTDVANSKAMINIKIVAQVKISSDISILNTAAENLLHKSDDEINEIATKTLEGHVRGVCARHTIYQININREEIAFNIHTIASADLNNIGIEIRSLVIKDVDGPISKHPIVEVKAIVGDGIRAE